MILKYLLLINDLKNEDLVTNVLDPIFEGDQVTEEHIKDNITRLELLLQVGENEIYEEIVKDLNDDDVYGEYMNK